MYSKLSKINFTLNLKNWDTVRMIKLNPFKKKPTLLSLAKTCG